MKFNWGHGIALTLVVFVLGIAFLIYRAHSTDFHVVDENYYELELKYQERIEALKNAAKSPAKVKFNEQSKMLNVNFQSTPKEAFVELFHPSGASSDSTIILEGDTSAFNLKISESFYGKYSVRLNWVSADKKHYQEETIFVL